MSRLTPKTAAATSMRELYHHNVDDLAFQVRRASAACGAHGHRPKTDGVVWFS